MTAMSDTPKSSATTLSVAESLTVLDLFAGTGGMTAGFHAAGGFRTVKAIEMDAVAAASYRATFGDIVEVDEVGHWLVAGEVPSVDVVVGGPPCKGFSTLGMQDIEDRRNRLWHDYAQVIVRATPSYFVLENVAAFRRSPQFAALHQETLVGGLLADYDIEDAVLNAADYGAPQARRRAIIIGHHRDLPAPGMAEPTHTERHRTVRQALESAGRRPIEPELPDRTTAVDGRRQPGVFTTEELHVGRTYTATSMARIRSIPVGGNRFDIPDLLLAPCWRKHKSGSADVMGRLHWDRPSVTIRTEFFKPEKGRYLHPTEHRALTHYEAALLQGFPSTHKWVGSKIAIARQIGNAVPLQLAQAIAGQLRQACE
jgi:DNA (cytosine-5)-methyltransferase 1